jgi:thiol-disulfide isomerase/thioredoxin
VPTTLPNALSELDRAAVWLNTEPLTAEGLRGKVVLVDFWTYSCVNWLRTLPYVRAWADRYRDRGLVVVGAHAPEFSFEHDLDNVRRAVAELDVSYPVVIDNEFAIWRSFGNHYWPAVYLVDMNGRVGFTHFGEEAYAETERAIQKLLGVEEDLVRVDAGGRSEAADWARLRTPETYVGYARGAGRIGADREPALNEWSLRGDWTVDDEFAELDAAGGSITFHFEGRDANLVLGGPTRFTVRLDGEPPGDDHGLDVSPSGDGLIDAPRMFQLVRQQHPGPRTVEITFADPGVRAYVFTFG